MIIPILGFSILVKNFIYPKALIPISNIAQLSSLLSILHKESGSPMWLFLFPGLA